jgi:hypothetical protein
LEVLNHRLLHRPFQVALAGQGVDACGVQVVVTQQGSDALQPHARIHQVLGEGVP